MSPAAHNNYWQRVAIHCIPVFTFLGSPGF